MIHHTANHHLFQLHTTSLSARLGDRLHDLLGAIAATRVMHDDGHAVRRKPLRGHAPDAARTPRNYRYPLLLSRCRHALSSRSLVIGQQSWFRIAVAPGNLIRQDPDLKRAA